MTRTAHIRNVVLLLILGLIGGYWYLSTPDKAKLDISAIQGSVPKVTEIRAESFPTIQIAKVVRWSKGATPTPPKDLSITPFAQDLDHPRWLHVLPNGDILVAESTQPSRPPAGLMDRLATRLMKSANGSDVSANRITLLRDTNGDGSAETRSVLLSGLNSPFGMALIGDRLFVANTDAVMAFPFKVGDTKIDAKGVKIMDLPANAPNNHWARNLIYDSKENMLYVTIGSNSNIAEGGLEAEKDRAQIKQYDIKSGKAVTFAYGLRNPNGLAFNPISGTLWATVNERDQLGSDGPPDYLTTIDFGTFYGWPFFFWGQNEDQRVPQMRPDLKQYSKRPDFALGPHVAALGLAFSAGKALGDTYANGAFIAEHGSWNRSPKSGYKVVFVPFNDRGFPVEKAKPVDVVTGFLSQDEAQAFGRPVGLAFDKSGSLLIADDAGNTIWRLSAKPKT
jgi:glucose/arabinose dehydrogenase